MSQPMVKALYEGVEHRRECGVVGGGSEWVPSLKLHQLQIS